VRDIDVLQEAARRADVTINFSLPTLDPDVWEKTEPFTAPPQQRLRALRRLIDAGIKAGVGMAPILPGLSDGPEQLADVVKAARDAGAAFVRQIRVVAAEYGIADRRRNPLAPSRAPGAEAAPEQVSLRLS
jgi:DNA repair photolyase